MKRYKNRATIRSQIPSNKDVSQTIPPQVSQSDSLIGGFMSSVIQGAALGTGSQLASRGVDAIMGPRKIEMTIPTNNDANCLKEQEAYISCMRNSSIEECRSIFEMLSKCKNI